jgi:hypothetical protein
MKRKWHNLTKLFSSFKRKFTNLRWEISSIIVDLLQDSIVLKLVEIAQDKDIKMVWLLLIHFTLRSCKEITNI